jgi:hypothetical protein
LVARGAETGLISDLQICPGSYAGAAIANVRQWHIFGDRRRVAVATTPTPTPNPAPEGGEVLAAGRARGRAALCFASPKP